MKVFSITKSSSYKKAKPQEDFFLISEKYPIFVVADGVSLDFDDESFYPNFSGASEVAKIFCQTVILKAESLYENFKKDNLYEVFKAGNKAVFEYNMSVGRKKEAVNYWDFDLFSTTTSFALIKDKKIYWWSLCDSEVALFDTNAKEKFCSPDGWINFPKDWQEKFGAKSYKEKTITMHKDYRNFVDEKNKLIGYGVVNGQESAENYLNTGVLPVKTGDILLIYTDGFKNYFSINNFMNVFKPWGKNIKTKIEKIVLEKSTEDQKKYGREKTLIAVSI